MLLEVPRDGVLLRVGDEDSNDAESNVALDLEEKARRQRLYWVLFIHERYFSIIPLRPVVLKVLPSLPIWHSSVLSQVQAGLCRIIHLFRIIMQTL